MAASIPIILCGRAATVGVPVIKGLLPKYEVIHMALGAEAGATDIPMILDGKVLPATDPPNLGSGDYLKSPVAVVMGRGYDEAQIKLVRDACKDKRGINWLRADISVPVPEAGPAYSNHIVSRVKACLDGLAEKGELYGEGVHLF